MECNTIRKLIQLIKDIKECWPDFDMTLNELRYPTTNTVKKFYEKFLHEFGIKQDHVIMLINQNFHEHEEFDDIIYMYVLFSCINHIYRQIDYTSSFCLTLTNLINPSDETNFITHVSLLSNYLYYVKNKEVGNIDPMKKKVLGEVEAFKELEMTVNSLNGHMKRLTCTRTKLMEKSQELKNNNEILKNSLIEPQLKCEQLDARMKILQDELNFLEKGKKQLDIEPDVTEEPLDLIDIENNESELLLLKIKEEVNKLSETFNLQKILDTYKEIEEHRSEKEKIIQEINAAHKIDDEVRNTLFRLNTEIKEAESQVKATDTEWTDINTVMTNEIASKIKEYENIKKLFHRRMLDAADLNKNIEHLSRLCDECKQAIEEDIKYYEKLYTEYFNVRRSLDCKVLTTLALIKKEIKLTKSD